MGEGQSTAGQGGREEGDGRSGAEGGGEMGLDKDSERDREDSAVNRDGARGDDGVEDGSFIIALSNRRT